MNRLRQNVAENIGPGADKIAPEQDRFQLDDVPKLTGKVAVVTGGSEGIGFGCVHTLLAHDIYKVFMLSTREDVKNEGIAALQRDLGESIAQRVVWKQCDLADWPQTGRTAFQMTQETDRLDILINDAGRGIMTRQLAPAHGVDLHMATNHIGHVVLTSHLLPLLKRTADQGNVVRIVNFSSNEHESAPKDVAFASLEELNRDYGPRELYGRSKLATLLHARYLARHLSGHPTLLVNAVHPGIVETRQSTEEILEPYPVLGHLLKDVAKPLKKDVLQGCVSAMFAATTTDMSGQYIAPPAIVEKGSEQANDWELAERLMRLTREVVEEKTREESRAKGCPFRDF